MGGVHLKGKEDGRGIKAQTGYNTKYYKYQKPLSAHPWAGEDSSWKIDVGDQNI